ncbi:MAG TPA: transcriptional regulator [Thermoanaerobaculia bacterium]|nr:transcriptional regulator [Thermoanaerobaculia bacterium]
MLLAEIVTLLGCTELLALDGSGGREIAGCFAADLMSEVLAFCGHGALLVTGLTNVQSVQTAEVVDVHAILYVNGKRPDAQVLALARARGLPLLSTHLTLYEACGLLHGGGLPASTKPGTAP